MAVLSMGQGVIVRPLEQRKSTGILKEAESESEATDSAENEIENEIERPITGEVEVISSPCWYAPGKIQGVQIDL